MDVAWNIRVHIAYQIASALSYIHNYKLKKVVCHGDVKPENVLLTTNLQVKLADFGSSHLLKFTGASSTVTQGTISPQYTLIYAAPELLENHSQAPNPLMDMYRQVQFENRSFQDLNVLLRLLCFMIHVKDSFITKTIFFASV